MNISSIEKRIDELNKRIESNKEQLNHYRESTHGIIIDIKEDIEKLEHFLSLLKNCGCKTCIDGLRLNG